MPPTKESPWILRMPIYVREENLENVIIYLYERLSEYARYAVFEWVENLKIFGAEPRIFFTYCQSDQNVTTDNQLVPVETEVPHRYTFQLHSISRQPGVGVYIRITANFVRRLFLQYSYDRSRGTLPRANIGRSKDLTTI